MKRKLDANDIPSIEVAAAADSTKFENLRLDSRLLQAVSQEKFVKLTPVQAAAIPLAFEGKDILARAKTGSGKTLAYVLPILQTILRKKAESANVRSTSALILVPTRELAEQIHKAVSSFSAFCATDIRSVNLTQRVSDAVQRSILAESPDIVIATPARASQCLDTSALSLEHLAHLVIDEADLVLSYGYEEDIGVIAKAVPHGVQTFLMSATLTAEVETLKGLFCRNPAVLKLEDKDEGSGGVSQYVVKCAEDEKFLLTYVIFKLQLIKGKCIIFVDDIDRCYRVKLFLEQFGIKSCVLNSELPVNSRLHVVEEFNKNVYDIIIAADEQEIIGGVHSRNKAAALSQKHASGQGTSLHDEEEDSDNATLQQPEKRRKLTGKQKDFGVSRGIDFQNVACVLNFDLPTTSKSYTHRIGRTARAGKTGMALSFVIPADLYGKHKPTTFSSTRHDDLVLEKITNRQAKKGKDVKPYHFEMKQVDAFRYRMGDALRAVTRTSVQEARSRELRQELIKSEKLRKHFEENPDDLRHLRHDGELRSARVQSHLKHVPDYLMPSKGKQAITGEDVGFVGARKTSQNRIRNARMHNRSKGSSSKSTGKKADPLKTFNARGRR